MTSNERQRVEGGVRKHLDRSLAQRLHQQIWARRLGRCESATHLERGSEFLRYPRNIRLGDNVIVKAGARICPANSNARISIGDWTTIGYHTHIFATSTIEIGNDCLIAPFCYLVDANHGIRRDSLIRTQPMSAEPIQIGDGSWLGANVTVLAGVSIGKGAVIGAGSVVNQDVAPFAIVSGIPAVQISERRDA